MPSVGGGGGGGGFHGGGFSGGGGGGFHGDHRGGGVYFFGGGIISSILSIVFMPLIFMGVGIFVFTMGITGIINPRSTDIDYNETTFVDLAMNKYAEYYGADENEILFVLLTSPDEKDGYYQISIVGNNIKPQITEMFGGDKTFFGKEFDNQMPTAYTNSGLNAFRLSLSKTADAIERLGYESNFYLPFEDKYSPRYENEAEYMNIDQTYLMPQLQEFKDRTGITFSIYIRDMDEVFSREGSSAFPLIIFGLIFFAAGAYVAFLGIRAIIKRREDKASKRSFDDFAREREDNSTKRRKNDENDPFDF